MSSSKGFVIFQVYLLFWLLADVEIDGRPSKKMGTQNSRWAGLDWFLAEVVLRSKMKHTSGSNFCSKIIIFQASKLGVFKHVYMQTKHYPKKHWRAQFVVPTMWVLFEAYMHKFKTYFCNDDTLFLRMSWAWLGPVERDKKLMVKVTDNS